MQKLRHFVSMTSPRSQSQPLLCYNDTIDYSSQRKLHAALLIIIEQYHETSLVYSSSAYRRSDSMGLQVYYCCRIYFQRSLRAHGSNRPFHVVALISFGVEHLQQDVQQGYISICASKYEYVQPGSFRPFRICVGKVPSPLRVQRGIDVRSLGVLNTVTVVAMRQLERSMHPPTWELIVGAL